MKARGIELLKFEPDEKLAAPDKRFFIERDGLMNITACTAVGPDGDASTAMGPPIYMSLPHFCHVDPQVAAMTEGTACDMNKHSLWLGVDPLTGITMAAAKRLQVSLVLPCIFHRGSALGAPGQILDPRHCLITSHAQAGAVGCRCRRSLTAASQRSMRTCGTPYCPSSGRRRLASSPKPTPALFAPSLPPCAPSCRLCVLVRPSLV